MLPDEISQKSAYYLMHYVKWLQGWLIEKFWKTLTGAVCWNFFEVSSLLNCFTITLLWVRCSWHMLRCWCHTDQISQKSSLYWFYIGCLAVWWLFEDFIILENLSWLVDLLMPHWRDFSESALWWVYMKFGVSEFLRISTTQRWRGFAPPASNSLIAPICAHLVARNRADRPAPSFACTSAPDEHSQCQQTATHCNTL